ncbi:hypothetical protein ACFUTV_23485 [Streptomyces sp. NPDC057298]|uniref:hypothetical protein n=1 Tax=Streptomyces sp. NPDC057298 TaxID=3346091 RepID=UPI00362FAC09
MNHTKRVLVALTLTGAVLTMSGAAHAQTPAAMANSPIRAIPAPAGEGLNILGINLGHILHGLGLGVGGFLGTDRGQNHANGSFLPS